MLDVCLGGGGGSRFFGGMGTTVLERSVFTPGNPGGGGGIDP